MSLRKVLTWVILMLAKPRVIYYYRKLLDNESLSLNELKKIQEVALYRYLSLAKMEAKAYAELIDETKISENSAYDFLQKLPIVTKQEIIKHPDDFNNKSMGERDWKQGRTGGSTGTPFKYRISDNCNAMAFAILYRGWGRGGYKLGDKIAVLAGGSLVEKQLSVRGRLIAFALNQKKYSSYGVDEALFEKYFEDMMKWRPKFLQGYVSSIYEYARFLERHNLRLEFEAVFTTAEMLLEHERRYIEHIFKCKVFNTYGLNDGGVSAFECAEGEMHIDMERSYLEVVDKNGGAVFDQTGRIVATSLVNDATFFVRYDTGDLGKISSKTCECGSPYPVMAELEGRKTDTLEINGKIIGSPVLTVLMSHIPVNRYQFVQRADILEVLLDVEGTLFDNSHEDQIKMSLFSQVGAFDLRFLYGVKNFSQTENSKHRVVVKID